MHPFLITALLTLATLPVQARMYQWVDPQTGTTQLAGKPPAWYRGEGGGPRVFVFDGGTLVDDTARSVSPERRATLRSEAFRIADADADADEAARLRAALGAEAAAATAAEPSLDAEMAELVAALGGGRPAPAAAATAAPAEPDAETTVARLKAVIEAWDRQQTERARKMIEAGSAAPEL